MFSLTSLKSFKIQKCPGNCKLVFFTLGPLTLRVKREIFSEMTEKMSEFVDQNRDGKKLATVRELSLVD